MEDLSCLLNLGEMQDDPSYCLNLINIIFIWTFQTALGAHCPTLF